MFDTLRRVTGRRLPYVIVPAAALLPFAWATTAVQRIVPVHLPAEFEGALTAWYDTRFDDSRTRAALGVQPRPLVETYRDTVRWLHQAGHLSARQAGAAAVA